MEAVPRLPMLNIPMKTGVNSSAISEAISKCIREAYHDNPELYKSELQEFEALRNSIINLPSDFTGCSSLKRYYCQLSSLVARFPINELDTPVSVTWVSGFDKSQSSGNMAFEMNCVMFNIAALHMSLGALDPRVSADGMKVSCTHFQCAAWAFQFVGENMAEEADLSPQLMAFLSHLALGQAQECILEKSMTDNRKPNIIAKVSMQVTEYFKACSDALEAMKKGNPQVMDRIGQKVYKLWTRYSEMKIIYYQAVTLFHQGLQTEEIPKFGDRIAFYQAAVLKLQEVTKVAKTLDKIADVWKKLCHDCFTFANDVIQGKLTVAEKENEFVYHEKVPPIASLPEVKGASLVKGIPFSFSDPEVAGPDIFGRLVPMEAHQASSMYSEEKAKLLRRICAQLQEKNEELETYLVSMQLDTFSMDDMADSVPQELVECCADMNSRDALTNLHSAMNHINELQQQISDKLNTAQDLLNDEEDEQTAFKKSRSEHTTPNQILNEVRREMSKYKEAIQTAEKNNHTLVSAIEQHQENLLLLSSPWSSVVEKLPCVAQVEGEGDKATRQEVQRLLRKVNEMQTQRIHLEDQLRENLLKDDVTKELVTTQMSTEEFFQQQLQKHTPVISLLEQNMSAQTNILHALAEANAAFASTRRALNKVRTERSEIVCSLISSYQAFTSICQKAVCAKEFFEKLDPQVSKLCNRVKSAVKVQQEERHQHLKASMKTAQATSHAGPRLKDYLASGHSTQRPTPLGSEMRMRPTETPQYPMASSFYPGPATSPLNALPRPQAPASAATAPIPKPASSTPSLNPMGSYNNSSSAQPSYVPPGSMAQPPFPAPTSSAAMPTYPPANQPYQRPVAPYPASQASNYPAPQPHNPVISQRPTTNYQNPPGSTPSRVPTPQYQAQPQTSNMHPNVSSHGGTADPMKSPYLPYPSSATHQNAPQYQNPVPATGYPSTMAQPTSNTYPGYRPPLSGQQAARPTAPVNPYSSHAASTATPNYPQGTTPYRYPYQAPPSSATHPHHHQQQQQGQQYANVPANSPQPQSFYPPAVSTAPQRYPVHPDPRGGQWTAHPPVAGAPGSSQHPGGSPHHQPQTSAPPQTTAPQTTAPQAPPLQPKPAAVSNVDLLSDIDLSQGSQWSPLVPTHDKKDTSDKANPNGALETTTNGTALNGSDIPASSAAVTSDASIIAKLAQQTKRRISVVDPLSDDHILNAFVKETEKLSKVVESLQKKSLNGPTNLEVKWKELSETLEEKCAPLKVSVGRCYPLKNRFPDVLPFDHTRVVLPSERDDYINASKVHVTCVDASYPVILTQAPMTNTVSDFWTMVWEHQVELIASLHTEAEVKGQLYYPREMGSTETFGVFSVSTKQVCEPNPCCTQRTLHLTENRSKLTKVILLMQFTAWPPSAMPESPSQFLQFINEVDDLQRQQRNKLHPVVVQCVPGTGRSGVFVLLSCFIKQLHSKGTIGDLWSLMVELCQQRRGALQDRSHVLFLYAAALYYSQDVLMKRGILTNKASFDDGPREKRHVRHPSADLLSDLSRIKANLGLGESNRSGSQCSLPIDDMQDGGSNRTSATASPAPSTTDTLIGGASLPPNLAASVDPNQLVLETPDPHKSHKITKDSFMGPSKGFVSDPSDPLGSLDPLWNIKKE